MSERAKELEIIFEELKNIHRREMDPNSEIDGKWNKSKGHLDDEVRINFIPVDAKTIDEITEFSVTESRKIEYKRR